MEIFKSIITVVIIAYALLLVIAIFFANYFIFVPPRPGYSNEQDFIKLQTKDKTTIYAIYLPNKTSKYTLLVSHGNAEDIGYILPFLREMQHHGFSVLAYDYHGYGLSGGKPSEANSYNDIDAAYEYLVDVLHVRPQDIILYGRSLGAAVALDLAIRRPVGAIIMEGGFVSAFRVVTGFPLLPFDKFNNLQKISKLTIPVLFIHGLNDRIVYFWHGKKLFQTANQPKQLYVVANAGHNNVLVTAGEMYWKKINDFLVSIQPLDKKTHI